MDRGSRTTMTGGWRRARWLGAAVAGGLILIPLTAAGDPPPDLPPDVSVPDSSGPPDSTEPATTTTTTEPATTTTTEPATTTTTAPVTTTQPPAQRPDPAAMPWFGDPNPPASEFLSSFKLTPDIGPFSASRAFSDGWTDQLSLTNDFASDLSLSVSLRISAFGIGFSGGYQLQNIVTDGEFALDTGSCTGVLAPGESCTMRLAYARTDANPDTAVLSIATDHGVFSMSFTTELPVLPETA